MLYYFLVIVLLLGLIYLIGSIVTYFLVPGSDKKNETFIAKLISGLIIFVLIYSVIRSKGNTVNIILIVPLSFFLYYLRSNILDKRKKNLRGFMLSIRNEISLIGLTLFYCLLWYIWQFSLYINIFGKEIVYAPFGDSIFYTDIITSLKNNGAENISTIKNLLFNTGLERTPYHYFELWVSAGISDLFNVNAATVFLLITPVLLFALTSILLFVIAKHFKINKYVCTLIPGLLFFGWHLIKYPFITELLSGRFMAYLDNYLYSYISLVKFQVYIYFLLGVIFFYYRGKTSFVYLLLMLPVFTFTALPATAGFIFIYLLLCLREKKVDRSFWAVLFTTLLVFAFLIFFYRSNFQEQQQSTSNFSGSAGYFKTIINIAGGTFLQCLYIYSPFFILLYLFAKMFNHLNVLFSKQNVRLIFYFISAFICGLAGWSLIHRQINSQQFFSNFFLCGITVLMIIQIIQTINGYSKGKVWVKALFLVTTVGYLVYCGIWNRNNHVELVNGRKPYSGTFYADVSEKLRNEIKNKIGVCFYSSEDYKKVPDFINSKVHWPAQVFKLEQEDFYVISLTDMLQHNDEPGSLDFERNETLKRSSVFSTWIKSKNLNDTTANINLPGLQRAFISENKIQFGIASRDAIIPPEIDAIKQTEIVDSISGYRFFLLKAVE